MADEVIGSVSIEIEGDYGPLEQAYSEAQASAQEAGDQIAGAFTAAAQSADAVTTSFQEAAGQLELFAAGPAGEVTNQLELFDTKSIQATDAMVQVGDAAQHAGEEAHESSGFFHELWESIGDIAMGAAAGLTMEKLVEEVIDLGKEAIETYAHIQKAEIALTALTGSAEAAEERIAGLKEMAIATATPFESLVSAAQSMTAKFKDSGISADQITEALRSAADAAAATGGSFDSTSNAIQRIVLSGNAGAKQLASLGISAKDLGDAMGVASGKVKESFKDLDQSERVEAIILALQKYQGVSGQVAQGIAGQWQNLKTQFEFALEGIGAALAPAVSDILREVGSMGHDVGELIHLVGDVKGVFEGAIGGISALAVSLGPLGIALSHVHGTFGDFLKIVRDSITPLFALAEVYDRLRDHSQEMGDALHKTLEHINEVSKAADEHTRSLGGLSEALSKVREKQSDADEALKKAKETLDAAREALDAGAISQGVYNRALTNYEKAVEEATPKTKDYAESIAGVMDALRKAEATFTSALMVFGQLRQRFDEGKISAAAFEAAYAKVEEAAKKAGQTFSDLAAEEVKLNQAAQGAGNQYQLWSGIVADLIEKQRGGIVVTDQLAIATKNLAAAAAGAHIPFASIAADLQEIEDKVGGMRPALDAAIGAFADLQKRADPSADSQLKVAAALAMVTNAAAAMGMQVHQLGEGLQFSVTDPSGPAAAALGRLADKLTQASNAGLDFVIVNGKMVPTTMSLADAAGRAAEQQGKLNDSISKVVTTSDGGTVVEMRLGESLERVASSAGHADSAATTLGADLAKLANEAWDAKAGLDAMASALEQAAAAKVKNDAAWDSAGKTMLDDINRDNATSFGSFGATPWFGHPQSGDIKSIDYSAIFGTTITTWMGDFNAIAGMIPTTTSALSNLSTAGTQLGKDLVTVSTTVPKTTQAVSDLADAGTQADKALTDVASATGDLVSVVDDTVSSVGELAQASTDSANALVVSSAKVAQAATTTSGAAVAAIQQIETFVKALTPPAGSGGTIAPTSTAPNVLPPVAPGSGGPTGLPTGSNTATAGFGTGIPQVVVNVTGNTMMDQRGIDSVADKVQASVIVAMKQAGAKL